MDSWKNEKLTTTYLEGVRGAIPLANTQMDVMHRIVKSWIPEMDSFLDLGCGDGILGRSIFSIFPEAKGVFLDFSEPMMNEAKTKTEKQQSNSIFITQDYSAADWMEPISTHLSFDLVITGFSVHHLEDGAKCKVYEDVFHVLKPGGLFLNLEHVASPSQNIEKLFDEHFIDSLISYHQEIDPAKTKEEIESQYYDREDKGLNKLAMVETQCDWLRDIGFQEVDCYFKIFELALFGGVKPSSAI